MAVGVGVAIAAVAWVLLALGARFAMVLVVAIVGVAAVEFYDKLREKGYQPATLAGLVAVVAMPLAAYWKGVAALPLVCFLAVVVTLVWFILAPGIESRAAAEHGRHVARRALHRAARLLRGADPAVPERHRHDLHPGLRHHRLRRRRPLRRARRPGEHR